MELDIPNLPFKSQYQEEGLQVVHASVMTKTDDYSVRRVDPKTPHRLTFNCIIYISEGSGTHFVDFEQYSYQGPCCILIQKGQVHAFDNFPHDAYLILFTEEYLDKCSVLSPNLQQLKYVVNQPLLSLSLETRMGIDKALDSLCYQFRKNDNSDLINLSFSMLGINLIELQQLGNFVGSRLQAHQQFSEFQVLLRQCIYESRSGQYYADKLNLSYKNLNLLCKNIIGKTTKQYINEVFVLEVKRRLVTSSLSIQQLSDKFGISEPTNFVKLFKKNTRSTPSEFRKKYQE